VSTIIDSAPIRVSGGSGLRVITLASLVIALLMSIASVVSILYRSDLYPAAQMAGNVGTDAVNLVIGLPMLLGTTWLARRGSLIGRLLWPGALLYVLYVYTFYLVGVPFNGLFLAYLTLVVLSVYTIIALVASIDGGAVRQRLSAAPTRIVGGFLALLAILFLARTANEAISAFVNREMVDPIVIGAWVSDFAVQCPALLLAGILLWRREALGYVAGAGLLLQTGVLFVSLPVGAALASLLIGAPFDASLLALIVMGAIPFGLLALFTRSQSSA